MSTAIDKTTTARVLICFIRHANSQGSVAQPDEEFFEELRGVIPNGHALDQHLHELDKAGVIYYDEVGEDGFAPYIGAGCTEITAKHLAVIIEEIESDMAGLRRSLEEILTFDPGMLKKEIIGVESQLKDARKSAEENELLKPLLRQISQIEHNFQVVSSVANKFEDVYKSIIRPVQLEGQSGVKATVRWAIISIVASTTISIVIGNWSALVDLLSG